MSHNWSLRRTDEWTGEKSWICGECQKVLYGQERPDPDALIGWPRGTLTCDEAQAFEVLRS